MIEACHTYEWVMSHMSHRVGRPWTTGDCRHCVDSLVGVDRGVRHWGDTQMNALRCIYEWVASRTEMSHVTYMNESRHIHVDSLGWHTHACDMSHTWIGHVTNQYVTYMNESRHEPICHIHEWVTSQTYKSHITYMNESRQIYVDSLGSIDLEVQTNAYIPTTLPTWKHATLPYPTPPNHTYQPLLCTIKMWNQIEFVCYKLDLISHFFWGVLPPDNLQHWEVAKTTKYTLQHTATHCNTLPHSNCLFILAMLCTLLKIIESQIHRQFT